MTHFCSLFAWNQEFEQRSLVKHEPDMMTSPWCTWQVINDNTEPSPDLSPQLLIPADESVLMASAWSPVINHNTFQYFFCLVFVFVCSMKGRQLECRYTTVCCIMTNKWTFERWTLTTIIWKTICSYLCLLVALLYPSERTVCLQPSIL